MSKAVKKSASAPVVSQTEDQEASGGVASIDRVFRGQQKVHHDLFKLTLAKMKKNVGIDEQVPDIEKVDHVHFYRTVDSNGKALLASAPVGGHHHNVKILFDQKGNIQIAHDQNGKPILDEDGKPFVMAEISEPLRWVKKKKGKRWVRFEEQMRIGKIDDGGELDEHTHQIVYLRSQMIDVRNIDPKRAAEAAKVESEYRAKREGSIEGVRAGSA